MYKKKFKHNLLAVSIAAICSTSAYAAETALENKILEEKEEEKVEIITVTGIKGSLLRSMDLKREA